MLAVSLGDSKEKELIAKVLGRSTHLDLVREKEPLIFAEIIKVFGIQDAKQTSDGLGKLKERLANICLQQKEDYLQYLSLPKFRQISQHAMELLTLSLQEISQLIKKQQEDIQKGKMMGFLNRYIPQCNTLAEMENYHLKIFELYTGSSVCPSVGEMNGQGLATISRVNNSFGNGLGNIFYSNFVKSQPECQRRDSFQSQNEQSQGEKRLSQYLSQRSDSHWSRPNVESGTKKRSSSHIIDEQCVYSAVKKEKLDDTSRVFEQSHPLSNISESRHRRIEVVDPNFKNCPCRGKIQKVGQKEFSCWSCLRKFHYECLKLADVSKEESKKKCPICAVEQVKSPVFELEGMALTSGWISYSRQQRKPHIIKFNQSLLNQMKSISKKGDHFLYLKMITISKRLQIALGQQNGKQQGQKINSKNQVGSGKDGDENGCCQEREQKGREKMVDECEEMVGARQQQNRELKGKSSERKQTGSSIELSAHYIQKLAQSPLPSLVLNFGYSPEYKDADKLYEEERLIYYGIYAMRKRKVEEVFDELRQGLEKCLAKQGKQIQSYHNHLTTLIRNKLQSEPIKMNDEPVGQLRGSVRINIKLLIENDVKQGEKQEERYPFRFWKCRDLRHVFDLWSYLRDVCVFNRVEDQEGGYRGVRLAPDGELWRECPKCGVAGDVMDGKRVKGDQKQVSDVSEGIYLDQGLFKLLNGQRNNSFVRGDQLMDEQVKQVKVFQVRLSYWLIEGEVGYGYGFSEDIPRRQQVESLSSEKNNEQDGNEIEDNQKNQRKESEKQQDDDQKNQGNKIQNEIQADDDNSKESIDYM